MMCNGTGKQRRIGLVSPDCGVTYELCSFCNGKGKRLCNLCNGRGYTEVLVPDFEPLERGTPFGNLGVDISTETRWSRPSGTVRTRSTTFSSRSSIAESVIVLVVLAMIGGIMVFGFEETLVAAEGFFIFAGWAGLRTADLFRKQESERLETFREYTAIGFGLCAGLLAAYLLLTTSEGRAINAWVTAQTIRLVGSLLASVSIPWLLELAWRKIV